MKRASGYKTWLAVAAASIALMATSAWAEAPAAGAAPAATKIIRKFDVRTPMRDGVELSSDVWMPEGPGPYPVILLRTPYNKAVPFQQAGELGNYFASHGYAFAVQDVRGRGDSDGTFNFFFQEAHDGYDSIEGLAKQPWANGRVCMMGVSYWGTTQWLAAKERPPSLKCIAPTSPAGRYLDELPASGGAFMMMWALNWLNDTSGRQGQGANAMTADMDAVYAHRPLITMDEKLGRKMPLFKEFLTHDRMDDYWKRVQLGPEDFAKIDIPVLATTGWFDGDQTGTLHYWAGMQAKPGGADQYLTIGPWGHIESFMGGAEKQGEIALSKDSIIDNRAMHLAFYDRYLKQSTTTFDQPKVRVFVSGINQWKSYDRFPVPDAKEQRLYFAGAGKANTAAGDGVLGRTKAGRGQGQDGYVFDPKNPVPLDLASGVFGADRSKVQARQDVLVYTSPALDKIVEVIGPVYVELWASSDAKDTDFTAALTDVGPDGKALELGPKPVGIIRARYRNGPESPEALLKPGEIVKYRIDLGAIGHAFLPGHRIRIEVSSSAYPMFNPNQNTGNPIATDTEWRNASQTIFHDASKPSALVLPVVTN
jgi:putative CocE/NonD family hydrolase